MLLVIPFAAGCQFWLLGTWAVLPVDAVSAPFDVTAARGSIGTAQQPGPMEAALYARAEATGQRHLLADTRREQDDPKRWARACDAGDDDACGKAAGIFAYFFRDTQHGLDVWSRLCSAGRGDSCLRIGDFQRSESGSHASLRGSDLYREGCHAALPSATACRRAANDARGRDWQRWSRSALELEDRACSLGDHRACSALARCLTDEGACAVPRDALLAEHYAAYERVLVSARSADAPELLSDPDRLERIATLVALPWPHEER